MKKLSIVAIALWLSIAAIPVFAQSNLEVPVNIQVSLFTRLLFFNKSISSGGNISVYVAGSHEFARAMKKQIGKKIGKSKLAEVISGSGLPEKKPSVIYIGSRSSLAEIIRYTRENKVLSITGIDSLVSEGVTLGLGVEDNKPRILLNLTSSVAEGVDWNHAILKVAATLK